MAADPVSPEAASNALNKIAANTAELADTDHVYKTKEQA